VDLTPVPMATVARSLSGRLVTIDADVNAVMAALVQVDTRFRAYFNEREGTFVLYLDDGQQETLVGVYDSWDERVVRRALEVSHPGYNFADEADRREAQAQKEHDDRMRDKLGDVAERLNFALQKDLGRHENPRTLKSRAFKP
jgi:hypothetical protein